ncbi:hypothetical protein CCHR01_05638 [Colletotrichum chrysophilum]|uniref:Uncharacterized protein n=1 Tax=Colletotrichum chrysophilum TaxID=1836956 RepID=A0AAD9ANX3_9PEZI|nr:hypothetical protein CCHR01_05638 [Colletotrichum chrysophilum]
MARLRDVAEWSEQSNSHFFFFFGFSAGELVMGSRNTLLPAALCAWKRRHDGKAGTLVVLGLCMGFMALASWEETNGCSKAYEERMGKMERTRIARAQQYLFPYHSIGGRAWLVSSSIAELTNTPQRTARRKVKFDVTLMQKFDTLKKRKRKKRGWEDEPK